MNKILVIQTAFLGDVVLATGVLEKLHSSYPDTEIHYLVRKGNHKLLEGHPFIEKLWVLDKKKKTRNTWSMIKEIRKERFDLVVNLQRFFTSGLITALSKGKKKYGFRKNPLSMFFNRKSEHIIDHTDNSEHEITRNHKLIEDLTDDQPAKPRLYPQKKDQKAANHYIGSPFICIAPSSIWFTKQWPTEKWIEFLDQLPENLSVYLLGAPSDHQYCQNIVDQTTKKQVENLAGKLSPLASTALMNSAIMNYVNDSAPLHFASAVNAPVTAIYSSTVPAFGFSPLSDNSHIVETKEKLACRPCGLHGHKKCPEGHFKCALNIEISQLMATLPK